MGFFHKKEKATINNNNKTIDEHTLFADLTQEIALFMVSTKIIEQPMLKFFKDDRGILEGLAFQHYNSDIKNSEISDHDYLFACGMHAFGAGLFVTLYQAKIKTPIADFTEENLMDIALAFQETDAYELGLTSYGIGLDSNNKNVIDFMILKAIETAANSCGMMKLNYEQLRTFMQVLFNAGVTMVLR